MNTAKSIFDKALASGKTRKEFLSLGRKVDGKMVLSGPHTIKLVSDKIGSGTDPFTKQPREELQVLVSENGVEKMWNIPLKDKDGNLHYLVQKLTEFNEGDMIVAEMHTNGMKNYVTVMAAESKSNSNASDSEEEEEIKAEDLPF